MEEQKVPPREERKSVSGVIRNRVPATDEDARMAMALRISERFHLPIERVYRMLGGVRAG